MGNHVKHILSLENYLNEGFSKINPGIKVIKAGIAGAPSAASYLKKAIAVMGLYDKLNLELVKARKEKSKEKIKEIQEKKKETILKLLELKKTIASKYPEEMKKIPSEKKEAAGQKASVVLKSFTDKVIKREKIEDKIEAELAKEGGKEEDGKEEGGANPEEIKQQMESIQKKIQDINDELQTEEGLKKYAPNIYKAIMNDEDIDEEEAASIVNKLILPLTDQYNKLKDQLDKVKGQDESYVWESIDLILEFDADAAVDKAESAIKSGIADTKDGKDGKGDDKEGDDKEGDDKEGDDKEGDSLEKMKAKLKEFKEEYDEKREERDNKKDEIADYEDMEDAEDLKTDRQYMQMKEDLAKLKDEIEQIGMKIDSTKEQIEEMQNESTNYKHIYSFSQFLRENRLS
jgi:hypothetical protein